MRLPVLELGGRLVAAPRLPAARQTDSRCCSGPAPGARTPGRGHHSDADPYTQVRAVRGFLPRFFGPFPRRNLYLAGGSTAERHSDCALRMARPRFFRGPPVPATSVELSLSRPSHRSAQERVRERTGAGARSAGLPGYPVGIDPAKRYRDSLTGGRPRWSYRVEHSGLAFEQCFALGH